MDTWSLPKARPIACNDCPAFQRPHMSIRWFAESIDLDLWLARIVRFTCTGQNELPFRTTRSGDNEVLAAKSRETAFEEIGARTPLRTTAFPPSGLIGTWRQPSDGFAKQKEAFCRFRRSRTAS